MVSSSFFFRFAFSQDWGVYVRLWAITEESSQVPIIVTNRGLGRSSSLLSLPGKSTLRHSLLILKLPLDTISCCSSTVIRCFTAAPVIWDGTAFDGRCPIEAISFQDATTADIGGTYLCGELSVTINNVVTTVDAGVTTTEVNSSLSFNAQPSLNGLTVRCRTGSNRVVDLELLIPGMSWLHGN